MTTSHGRTVRGRSKDPDDSHANALRSLFIVADTDLLAVYPTELAQSFSVPRLGELNGPQPSTSKRATELQPEIEPGESMWLSLSRSSS